MTDFAPTIYNLSEEGYMKRVYFALAAILLLATTGCAPDLVVRNLNTNWDDANKNATAVIENIGNKEAGNFLVYFNPDENPESQNHRPQVSHNVSGLAAGGSITLYSDFAPLAHPDNYSLGNVYQITVIADPKSMVDESNENNNDKVASISMPDLVITDMYQDGPYIKVTYKNIGAPGNGDFLIKLTNNSTGGSFPGNSFYRFPVPPPNVLQTTGGFTLGLIDLQQGVSENADLTAEIDWEERVAESDESNNILTKMVQIQ